MKHTSPPIVVSQPFLATVSLSPADSVSESNPTVKGGDFTFHTTRNGVFIFADNRGRVNITGGVVSNTVAEREGGAVSGRRSLTVVHCILRQETTGKIFKTMAIKENRKAVAGDGHASPFRDQIRFFVWPHKECTQQDHSDRSDSHRVCL